MTARSSSFQPCCTAPLHLQPTAVPYPKRQFNSGSKQLDFFPGFKSQCSLKMQRHRGYWRRPGAKVAESRGVWLKASRRRECLRVGSRAARSPSPTKTERLAEPPESPFTCPTAPSRRRTALGGRRLRGLRGVTHTKAPCASALRDAQPGRPAPHPGRAGRRPPPEIRTPNLHPPFGRHPCPPSLKIGLPSACHNPHPRKQAQERGAHRPL